MHCRWWGWFVTAHPSPQKPVPLQKRTSEVRGANKHVIARSLCCCSVPALPMDLRAQVLLLPLLGRGCQPSSVPSKDVHSQMYFLVVSGITP